MRRHVMGGAAGEARIAVEKHLRKHGCVFDHHGGEHDVWRNSLNEQHEAVPRHAEINTFTARAICKGLGIPRPPMR